MNKTRKPCFSNGTECGVWFEYNCYKCIKNAKDHDVPETMKCSIQRDIYLQMFDSDEINVRSYEATQKNVCPYIKTEYPSRKPREPKKDINQLELFK